MSAKREEILVARNDVVGTRLERAGDNHIVVGVADHPADSWKFGDNRCRSRKKAPISFDAVVGIPVRPAQSAPMEEAILHLIEDRWRKDDLKEPFASATKQF
jgi:hypothetical protein